MRLLGVVLAGGASRRFGSDKALALFEGRALIDHVVEALAAQADAVAVAGRQWRDLPLVTDEPAPGLGPLGGLCGALHQAAAGGYDAVLTAACDAPILPLDLVERLGAAPVVANGQPTVGIWPVTLAAHLAAHIKAGDRSLHGWIAASGARAVDIGLLANVNTSADLAALSRVPVTR